MMLQMIEKFKEYYAFDEHEKSLNTYKQQENILQLFPWEARY